RTIEAMAELCRERVDVRLRQHQSGIIARRRADVDPTEHELTPCEPRVGAWSRRAPLGAEEHDGCWVRARRVPLEGVPVCLSHGVVSELAARAAGEVALDGGF